MNKYDYYHPDMLLKDQMALGISLNAVKTSLTITHSFQLLFDQQCIHSFIHSLNQLATQSFTE